jgi:iron complex outermembrane receptor protein
MSSLIRRALVAAFLPLFAPVFAPVFAQAPDAAAPAEVIVTGTKFAGDFGGKSGIALEKVPQSVQVISEQDIVELGARTVGDLLRTVPSANPGYSRVGAYQSFSLKIRGFLADQMRNGIRQRYYEDVDASALSNIERVEVLKGPSGVLYGQSAVGGILSIVTRRPQDEFAASLAAVVGNDSRRQLTADVTGGVAPGLALRLTGEVERSGTFVDRQDLDRDNVALSLRAELGERAVANVVTEYVQRHTQRYAGLPLAGTVQSNGVGELPRGLNLGEPAVDEMNASAPLVQAWVDVRLADAWTLTPRLQYQQFNTRFTQIRVRTPAANLTTINRNGRTGQEDDAYAIAQLDLSGAFATGAIEHKVLAGYEYDRERAQFAQFDLTNVTPISVLNPVYAFDTAAPAASFAYDQDYNTDGHALYLQDQLALTSRWDVVASLRHSWLESWTIDDFAHDELDRSSVQTTTWQLGTTYALGGGLSAYGGYSAGFDVESTAGARSASGAPLRPERSRQFEAGLRYSGPAVHGSAAAFQIERIDALTTDPLNPDYSLNVGRQRVRGVELEGEWQPTPQVSVGAGYALLVGRITQSNEGDEGGPIGDVPRHTLTARARYAVPGTTLAVRGSLAHVTDRALVNGSAVRLPGYTLLDLGATYDFDAFTAEIFVANITDERYYTASGNAFAVMPGDPRSLQLRLATRW